jgi:hypothetical protein
MPYWYFFLKMPIKMPSKTINNEGCGALTFLTHQ